MCARALEIRELDPAIGVRRSRDDPDRVPRIRSTPCPLVHQRHPRETLSFVQRPVGAKIAIEMDFDGLVDGRDHQPCRQRAHRVPPRGEGVPDEEHLRSRLDGDELVREAQASTLAVVPELIRFDHGLLMSGELGLARFQREGRLANHRQCPRRRSGTPEERRGAERREGDEIHAARPLAG